MRTPTRNSIHYRFIAVVLLVVILPVAVMAQGDPNCCIGRVGDANGLGGDEPTIADVSVMIDAKFITYMPCWQIIPCLQEADVNQSGGTDPSCFDITVGDISILIDYLFITGSSLGLPDCPEPSSDPYGYVVDRTDCITDAPPEVNQAASSASCLWYEYDGVGTLDITHQNAVLNCCPMPTLSVEIEGDTITITEADEGLCDCYCLYDIDYRLVNLPPGEYRIIVYEAYPAGGDPLDFTIDLVQNPTNLLCVERTGYPWGGGATELEFIGNSGCLSQGAATSAEVNDQTCVSYEYNEFGTLSIYRGMAGFNCCPSELGASFSIDGNTITITEIENLDDGGCHCLCLFDLEYEIVNLPPGEYNIVIEEPYLPSGDQPLEFIINLTAAGSGTFCVERTNYPWGQ